MATAFAAAPEILFVVAAGNDGEEIDSVIDVPASINLPNVLCVSALGTDGQRANFSNYGSRVDVYLPGEQVPVTMPDGSVQLLDGTSVSVPQATNKALQLLQQNRDVTASQLKQLLIKSYPLPQNK